MAQKQAHEKMTTLSLDTSVLISHLRGDRFAEETDLFLRRAMESKTQLVIPDVVYAELYTGIFLASDPKVEEAKVQGFLGVNNIEVRTSKSLKTVKRAGELYSKRLRRHGGVQRILPDFLTAAQAEATSKGFVTWNEEDYEGLGLQIRVLRPNEA